MPNSGSGSPTGIVGGGGGGTARGFTGFMPGAPYGDVGSSSFFLPIPGGAGGLVARAHPDYAFAYIADTLFYADAPDNPPLKWRLTRRDGVTPAHPTTATVKVWDEDGALVATLTPDRAPSPQAGSVELAALWPISVAGTYLVELTVVMPSDGQIRSTRVLVTVL